jgi:hypothetical protein
MFGPRSHAAGEGVTVFWKAPDSYSKHFAHLSEAQKFLKVQEVDIKSAMITGKPFMTTVEPLSLKKSLGFRDREGRSIVQLSDSCHLRPAEYRHNWSRLVPVWLLVDDPTLIPAAGGPEMHPTDETMYMFPSRTEAQKYLGKVHDHELPGSSTPLRLFIPDLQDPTKKHTEIVTCLDPDKLSSVDSESLETVYLRGKPSMWK